MTAFDVFERATHMTPAPRWHAWTHCGAHDVRSLPTADTAGRTGPPHYCPNCWTIFSAETLQPFNEPVGPARFPIHR